MDNKNITERLKRVVAIVDGWQRSESVPQIERDIALAELREVYNELLVLECNITLQQSVVEPKTLVVEEQIKEDIEPETEVEAGTQTEAEERDSFYDALDIDALLGLSDEPSVERTEHTVEVPVVEESLEESENIEEKISKVSEPEVVSEPTPEPISESISEPTPEPIVDVAKSLSGGLFDLNDIPVRSKSKRKMISLYSDNPIATNSSAESEIRVRSEKIEEPQTAKEEAINVAPTLTEPVQRLGDSFAGVTTLADKMAHDDAPTTPFNRIKELRQAIGLNDKFLMVRDLFDGDVERYEATIDTLDEFEDLDECIIYIVENFRWNPDLEASKLLISLIERKLA
ncbi:MAG: hypothetical protein IKJ08_08015 [Alistipes sp.]|nr:hypothetical protein [Alistipes sp.]